MIVVSGHDPLHDAAVKDSEEKKKQYEDAMKANKDGLKTIDNLNKLENTGEKIKSSDLKKMHLSESAFMDIDIEDEDIDECIEEVNNFIESLNSSKLAFVYPKRTSKIVEQLANLIPTKVSMYEGLAGKDEQILNDNSLDESFSAEDLAQSLYTFGKDYDYYEFMDYSSGNENEDISQLISDINDPNSRQGIIDFLYDNVVVDAENDEQQQAAMELIQELQDFNDSLTEAFGGSSAWDKLANMLNIDDDSLDEALELNEEESFLDKINANLVDDSDLTEGLKKKTLTEALSKSEVNDICNKIMDEYPGQLDVENVIVDNKPYATIDFMVKNGDWKHDHLAFRYWMDQHAEDITNCTVKFGGEKPTDDSQDDTYSAVHTYYFIPKDEELPEKPEDLDMESEPLDTEQTSDSLEDVGVEFDEEPVSESLKFNIAKEQIKRFNEGKMPKNWSAKKYLEKLVRKHHITKQEGAILQEAFLKK